MLVSWPTVRPPLLFHPLPMTLPGAAHAMGELSVELFRLKNFMGEFGDSFLATSINRFAEVFSQVQTLNSELVRLVPTTTL